MIKILNYLGLAKRAGKLVSGTDAVIKNLRKLKTHLIFVANDASALTQETVEKKGMYYQIPIIKTFSTEELSKSIGAENIKVIGINDQGFTKAIQEELERGDD